MTTKIRIRRFDYRIDNIADRISDLAAKHIGLFAEGIFRPQIEAIPEFALGSSGPLEWAEELDLDRANTDGVRISYWISGLAGGIRSLVLMIPRKPEAINDLNRAFGSDHEFALFLGEKGLHSHFFVALNPAYREREPTPWELYASVKRRAYKYSSLLPMEQVPGFGRAYPGFHSQGWYSKGLYALELPSPGFAPGARAFDIFEGIYIFFEDESIRLMPRREYFEFLKVPVRPALRQGDIFLLEEEPPANYLGSSRWIPKKYFARAPIAMGRHRMIIEDDLAILIHPDHPRVAIPKAQLAGLLMLPGVSHPFNGGEFGDSD
jgi:hypothetical protein